VKPPACTRRTRVASSFILRTMLAPRGYRLLAIGYEPQRKL
jgi:hypothetical protein